jgi:hypothetical protein
MDIEIESRVAGIPCLIRLGRVDITQGTYSPQADNQDEYFGHTDIEFEVLDRRGRHAPWLERKLTDDNTSDIEQQLLKEIEAYDDY